jgi:hypothetical protein
MKKFYLFVSLILSVMIVRSQNVGIGTNFPIARLHVGDSSVIFNAPGSVPADISIGNPPLNGNGRYMMWYADKGAFRSGYTFQTEWLKDNIGKYSFASGYQVMAKGK